MNWGKKKKALQEILIRILESKMLPEGSYLAGGTALYLYLQHRLSIDLDFFTPRPFIPELLLSKMREPFNAVDLEILQKETLVLFLSGEKIKFSLFYLPYSLLAENAFLEVKKGVFCPLASLDDIEAMKALALAQRGSAKDFVDLYFLLQKTGHNSGDLFARVQQKYQMNQKYNYHLKTAMVYFDDAELEIDSIFLVGSKGAINKISKKQWNAIKEFFVRFCQ